MRLGDILKTAGKARPVTLHPVTFSVIGENEQLAQVKASCEALLQFVPESEREQLRVDLHADLQKRFADKFVPETVVRDEEIYHLLVRALRDKDTDDSGYHKPFAEDVAQLRASLVLVEARRLMSEYELFIAREFPAKIDDETWRKLVDDAKKNSLSDLLTAYGFEKVLQVASFLVVPSGK